MERVGTLQTLTGAQPVSPWRRLAAWMGLERRDLWALVAYSVCVGGLSLVTPVAVQALIHTVTFATLLQPLLVLAALLTVALLFAATLVALQTWIVELISRRVFLRVVADFSTRLPRIRHDALPGQHAPELVNRFFDVVTIEKTVSALLTDGLAASLQIAAGMALLAVYHPLLLAFDLALCVALAIVTLGLGRGAVKSAILESKLKYKNADWLETLARHELLFKGHLGQRWAVDQAETLASGWLDARKRHFGVVMRQIGALLLLEVVVSAGLLTLGGALVIERQLSLGQLVAAEIVVAATIVSLGKLSKLFAKVYDLLAAVDKIGTVLDLPQERVGGEALPSSNEGLKVRVFNLRTQTPAGVLRPAVNLELRPGERVALVAGPGGGRRALLEALVGLREAAAGAVEIGGLDVRDLDLGLLRDDAVLLHGGSLLHAGILASTVFDNIACGREMSRADVRRALEAVGLRDAMTRLPEGLDTRLDVDGDPLTREELALLPLARLVSMSPRLLCVDRALDAMPPSARKRALDLIFDPDRTWTVLCVTDDPEVERRCQRRVVVGGPSALPPRPGHDGRDASEVA